jgi:hypothetical protein
MVDKKALRDQFAMHALAGMLSQKPSGSLAPMTPEQLRRSRESKVRLAYEYADIAIVVRDE